MVNLEDLQKQEEEIEGLLELVYQLSRYDFRDYAPRSLRRRIARYMSDTRLGTVAALREQIMLSPETIESLLASLTIDFTSMFRDAGFFTAFRRRVIPMLRDRAFIRIWHAGCASGEEVYSMAILLEEEGLYEKARLYATDMNPKAILKARRGIFPINRMKEFTRNYLSSGGLRPFSDYYSAVYNHAILLPALQRNIIWAQHNLACDGKFNDFDVIICRNVLIYFNQDLKDRVHSLLYESLEPSGILGLGSHETIEFSPYAAEYMTLDAVERLYLKVD